MQMIHKEGNQVYSEVEALSVLKGYKTANAGCCKVREGGALPAVWAAWLPSVRGRG